MLALRLAERDVRLLFCVTVSMLSADAFTCELSPAPAGVSVVGVFPGAACESSRTSPRERTTAYAHDACRTSLTRVLAVQTLERVVAARVVGQQPDALFDELSFAFGQSFASW